VFFAADDHHGVAVVVLLVLRHAELVHQRMNSVLARPDPGSAAIDPRTVRPGLGEGAATDPITRLQQGHRMPRLFEPQRGRQPRESRSDHAEIDLRHGWLLNLVHPSSKLHRPVPAVTG
jgi:hypothetical protein